MSLAGLWEVSWRVCQVPGVPSVCEGPWSVPEAPWGSWGKSLDSLKVHGGLRESLGIHGTSSGGSEGSLRVAVSATRRFVMSTKDIMKAL